MYNHSDMLDRIKAKKKELKLTNHSLAEKTGIPIGTLNKILSGDSKDPQISAIIKISQALEVSADYIVFGLEDKQPYNIDAGIEMYNSLDQEDKAEIRGEIKQMLKADKYKSNNNSLSSDIIDEINKIQVKIPINTK